MGATAQTIVYNNLKGLVAHQGDTIVAPRRMTVEERSKHQIMLTGGADYKISANRKILEKFIKSRYYAIAKDGNLYVNCKKLKINKFRFGGYYASAMWVKGRLYFCAHPVGPAAVSLSEGKIGMGVLGDAIANSALTSERVFYEIDTASGEIQFVGKEKMLSLLQDHQELKDAFLKETGEEARVTGKYLKELQKMENK